MPTGKFIQSDRCRIRELEAQNERLKTVTCPICDIRLDRIRELEAENAKLRAACTYVLGVENQIGQRDSVTGPNEAVIQILRDALKGTP